MKHSSHSVSGFEFGPPSLDEPFVELDTSPQPILFGNSGELSRFDCFLDLESDAHQDSHLFKGVDKT